MVLDAIHARRTIREFTTEPVSNSDLETMIEAATWAPNHRGTEPWRFIVLEKDGDTVTFFAAHHTPAAAGEDAAGLEGPADQGKTDVDFGINGWHGSARQHQRGAGSTDVLVVR